VLPAADNAIAAAASFMRSWIMETSSRRRSLKLYHSARATPHHGAQLRERLSVGPAFACAPPDGAGTRIAQAGAALGRAAGISGSVAGRGVDGHRAPDGPGPVGRFLRNVAVWIIRQRDRRRDADNRADQNAAMLMTALTKI
jgi:hypothetical protein